CQHVSPVPRSIPRTGSLKLAVLWRLTVRSYCCAKVRSSVSPTIVAKFLVALAPAPHVPVADADNLRCLPPGDLLGHRPQNHFLYFHRPLHRGLRVKEHVRHVLLLSPPAKRTFHVLIRPDISCVNDTCSRRAVRSKLKCPLFLASEMSGFS